MKKNISNLSFEESLKKLEDIVDQLDSGEIDLEKSADIIQQGWKPTRAFSKDDLVQFLNYVVQAYTMYENSKGEEIDYSDMLLLFLEKFQDDKFEYVLVDEMQDMNEIEARIINMISKNLFIV